MTVMVTPRKPTPEALEAAEKEFGNVYQCIDPPLVVRAALFADRFAEQRVAAATANYEEVLADKRALVHQIDVALNGDGAARQASLCDIMPQILRLSVAQKVIEAARLLEQRHDEWAALGGEKYRPFQWALEQLFAERAAYDAERGLSNEKK